MLAAIFVLVVVPYFLIVDRAETNWVIIVFGVPAWLIMLRDFRELFCPFVIDERGITSKFPFRNIFISWDEMKYIQVGERRYNAIRDFRFIMCFSKVPLKTVFLNSHGKRPTSKRFYIMYKDGMLEEILKYVDESRIRDVSRIKGNPRAAEMQDRATSLRGGGSLERLDPNDRNRW